MNHYLNDPHKKQNKNIFSVSSIGSLGCTFLEWSIHWIVGNDIYFHTVLGNIPLVSNPVQLSNGNAHLHRKNHPSGFKKTKDTIEKLLLSGNSLLSLYPIRLHPDDTARLLELPIVEQIDQDQLSLIKKEQDDNWFRTWEYLGQQEVKRIVIALPKNLYLYNIAAYRSLDRQFFSPKKYKDVIEAEDDYSNRFFKDSLLQYNTMEIWDRREFMAITLQCTPTKFDADNGLELQQPHKFINVQSLWHNGEKVILEVMDYLGLSINKDRLHHWRSAYQDWQRMQLNIVNFVYDFDFIINSIVNNYDFDLTPYNLSLRQEAIIQNKLMKNYNLTIKNWQLEKFPINAKGVHALLEENFHKF